MQSKDDGCYSGELHARKDKHVNTTHAKFGANHDILKRLRCGLLLLQLLVVKRDLRMDAHTEAVVDESGC